jgi:UDP-N-acetylmuramoyl-tripeptide--D-alanyl-D-alanine ligase
MRLQDFLDLAAGSADLRFSGETDQLFNGFSMPGTQPEAERFFVVIDESWPYHQRIKVAQNDWSLQQLADHVETRGLERLVVPTSLGEEPFGPGKNYMYVAGTYPFVAEAGLRGRARAAEVNSPVVAVTGSAGKSTFKAMFEAAYSAHHQQARVLSPPPHFNTYIRVLAELTRAAAQDITVLELSAGGRGAFFNESRRNGTAISPDVAVVTGISHAHTRVMKHLGGVVRQKSEIFRSAPEDGTAVINGDSLRADQLRERALNEGWKLSVFGEEPHAQFQLLSYSAAERRVQAKTPYGKLDYLLGADGRHMAHNSLAVLASLWGLGITDSEPVLQSFENFSALPGRGEVAIVSHPQGGQVQIIDETYNANPASMTAVLETLDARPGDAGQGRKVAVIGDMLMLGEYELKLHRRLFDVVDRLQLDHVYLVGDLMGQAYQEVGRRENLTHLGSRGDLIGQLRTDLRGGDVVAFKASQAVGLDQVIAALLSEWSSA